MPWRFRRSFKILPGIKINLSKGGVSTSLGGSGHSLNIGKKGVRSTVGLPGTGISFSQQLGNNKTKHQSTTRSAIEEPNTHPLQPKEQIIEDPDKTPPANKGFKLPLGCLIGVGIFMVLCFSFLGVSAVLGSINPTPHPTLDIKALNTSVALTAWAPVTLTAASVPTSTATCTETLTPTLTAIPSATNTIQPSATNTLVSFPTSITYPTQPPSGGGSSGGTCCKYCTNSQPCGDSCIPKSRTCTKTPGCACP